MTRCILIEDFDKTTYEIDTPLSSVIDYEQVRTDLGIPEYVDHNDFLLERGIMTVWAAMLSGSLDQTQSARQSLGIRNEPIPVLFFGGGAVKLLCPAANESSNPLCRDIGDIDLITTRKSIREFYKLLLGLGDICGTRYYHFVTRTDRRFNAMRMGTRFRVRAIDKIVSASSLRAGSLDVFTDEIALRHKVDVRPSLKEPKRNMYTIGAEALLLTKCQYIFDIPKSACDESLRQEIDYRILDYAPYKDDRLLIGIEEKDIKDICAVLLSHDIDQSEDCVRTRLIKDPLEKDKKFALTFRLNFEKLVRNEDFLKQMGLSNSAIETILSRAQKVLEALPVTDKRWNNPWWNVDVETPKIFGKNTSEAG